MKDGKDGFLFLQLQSVLHVLGNSFTLKYQKK